MDYEGFEDVLADFAGTDNASGIADAEVVDSDEPELVTTVVTLAVTVTRDGEEAKHREFVTTLTGTSATYRPAFQVLFGLDTDADKWLGTLDRANHAPRPIHMVGAPRLTPWQRFVFAVAGVKPPQDRPVQVRKPWQDVEATEIGDGTHSHLVAVRVTVDSPLFTDKAEQHGTTNGSVISLATGLITAVTNDARMRLSDRYLNT